jgi:hypothetical protein
MPAVLKDRVLELSTSVGDGDFTLAGPATGYRSFNSALSTGNTTFYTISCNVDSTWEVGVGTFTSPNLLTRNTIIASSSSGARVTFASGTKRVFITYLGEKAVYTNTSLNGIAIGNSGELTSVTPSTGLTLSSTTLKAVPRNAYATSYTTWSSATTDQLNLSAQTGTVTIGADVDQGTTATNGQKFTFRITGGTGGCTLSFSTSGNYTFRDFSGLLPTAQGVQANQTIYVGCMYNSTALRWDLVAVAMST